MSEGIVQLWRNKFLSITTIGLGALILLLLNFVFAIQFFATNSIDQLEQRADFSVPMRESVDLFELDALKNDLKNFDVSYEILSAEYFEDFSLPQRMHVQFHDLNQVRDVLEIFKKARYAEVVGGWDRTGEQEFSTVVQNLLRLRKTVESAAKILAGLFLAGGILLVINTFRIALFSRRQEVFVARLVGADRAFISGPFVAEGVFLGLISALLAIVIFIFVLREISVLPGAKIFLHLWNDVFSWEILVSGAVGALGAWISVRKYLTGKFGA